MGLPGTWAVIISIVQPQAFCLKSIKGLRAEKPEGSGQQRVQGRGAGAAQPVLLQGPLTIAASWWQHCKYVLTICTFKVITNAAGCLAKCQ